MDIYKELDRLTEPLFVASKVHTLTRDEIDALVAQGQITPIEQIPEFHQRARVHYPAERKGTYDRKFWR